ncbi:response regulator transcription factor [Chromatocurvus halotolerans]|uniref:Winged helix family two component transcriptional regulator n=1 Tax=Chromatocurvus halotolerans TaxID=1132028 RepID=A0A4R2KWA6_9GAMM|nr:response regulator transcription factor [Chromatocurvus halotolerans]TCO75529.1 winged helix family two component transcriptional regulator [Chromatocurvus halotolerans]
MNLCLVEDDHALSAVLTEGLVAADYRVQQSYSGIDALRLLNSGSFDLAIIDIGLQDLSGINVIRRLRNSGSNTPILILTARHGTEDRVLGLDAGADDYLAKPFDFDELLARLRAILRRASGTCASALECGPLRLELATQTAALAGQPLPLTRREFMLLRLLLENAGRIVTRDRLETELYGWLDPVASNAIEVHVHHLRKKLGAERIRTMRGVGYMLVTS